jgi:putative DNA primase/helicase
MFITNKAMTAPDWTMPTPTFDKFLPSVMSGEKDRRDYLLRFFGYALTGVTGEDTLTFLLGTGGNGKSTLVDLLTFIIGRHYCLNRRTSVLLEKRGESNDDGQKRLNAQLYSKRLFLADEANRNMKFDQAQLKSLSTTSRLSGALLYENEMTFQSTHKIVISLDKPPILEGTAAMSRRLHLVEFKESFPVDRTLLPALKREAPGILARLIDGCIEWQRNGLCPPASVQTASKEMLSDADIFGRWLSEKTEYAPGVDTSRAVLQASFDTFRHGEGDQTVIKASEFTQLFRCDQRFNRAARPYVDGVQVRGIGNIRLKSDKTDKTRNS